MTSGARLTLRDALKDEKGGAMTRPRTIRVVDAMIGFPSAEASSHYDYLRAQTKDAESQSMEFPAEYMFKAVPNHLDTGHDGVAVTLQAMDTHGIEVGLIGLGSETSKRALREHPTRFRATLEVDPNDITGTVRAIRAAKAEFDIVAVTSFPAGCNPQVPVNDRRYYPVYQTCIDLNIPVVVNAGIAGPRLPSACQDVFLFDEVCYDFPELTIIMRHGAEPFEELAVKLMLKWPGLHYMTSAFAPKYYPKAIVDYANTRGTDKILYAGYYPMGLTLDRIFTEMDDVPFRDHVWEPFLSGNARRLFNLGN